MASVTRTDALKILSSADPKVIRKTVEFFASSIDCFLQDYSRSAGSLIDPADTFSTEYLDTKALMASRIVTMAAEMLMFFGALEADSKNEAARLAATESIQCMVDRQLKALVAQCEHVVN